MIVQAVVHQAQFPSTHFVQVDEREALKEIQARHQDSWGIIIPSTKAAQALVEALDTDPVLDRMFKTFTPENVKQYHLQLGTVRVFVIFVRRDTLTPKLLNRWLRAYGCATEGRGVTPDNAVAYLPESSEKPLDRLRNGSVFMGWLRGASLEVRVMARQPSGVH